MQIITINVPDAYIKSIEHLKEKGYYDSRSEFIREAIRDMLDKMIKIDEKVQLTNLIPERPRNVVKGDSTIIRVEGKEFKVMSTQKYIEQKNQYPAISF